MTELDVALLRLLLAAAGSLAAGCAVWAVAVLCRRCLPALAQQRSLWLLGQAAVAAVFVAMLLPTTEGLRVVPVIEMGELVAPRAPVASAPPPASPAVTAMPAPAPAPRHAWLRDAARAWLALYLLGLGHALYRWRRGQQLLDALATSGSPFTAPLAHAGFAARAHAALPAVIEVEAPISPMLQGLFKPRLLLPHHLRNFAPLQQQLIVEHELTHWRRHDLRWSAAALVLQSLFWFNPFMRMLRARLGWAQEFGCDRDVLRGRPQSERKAYAAALVAQLKLQRHPTGMALAFGASDAGSHAPTLAARINLIRTPTAARGGWSRLAAFGSLAAVAAANLALQPALGWHAADVPDGHAQLLAGAWPGTWSAAPAPLDCTVMVDADSGAALVSEGSCDARVTPASTFKIAISLMGFDSGVLRDEHAPYLPYKASYASRNPSWRHGTDPAGWLRESIVWYSQQVTLRLGAASVRGYVQAFDYGNRDLASVAGMDDAVALSELSPTLRISPLEQIVFLRKVVNRGLPLSAHAYDMTTRLLKLDAPANGWEIYGKTGTASARLPDGSADETQNIGWFVGWATKGGRKLVFARLMQHPVGSHNYAGAQTRDAFLSELERRAP
ncbi:class D beta-lactamase [Rugamonas sp. CCM 8940]|uniref:class D beta-lactamase n=1 Tax=Rugamonas sp. CCM 8940 TaxID=2765359 RepID=UPI0018F597B9|nr:class D beta-lactamase [Rugamonas sp. CCM 8940]MBJ7310533.1 class D beta-lactamase [Rugamonas sp. CCM 8940]